MREISLKGESLSDRARKNLTILDTIRRSGPISKTDISSIIGVNVVTVSHYIEDFLREQIIFEKELDVSKGGRRPVLLDLNADSGYVIGIGFNLISAIGVVTDLRGKLIHKIKKDRPKDSTGDIVNSITSITKELLDKAPDLKNKIKGIGIGIAGIVDNKRDTVRWPERVNDSYDYKLITLPLKDIIEKEFRYPVRIENDATVACFGEQWLTQGADTKDLIYMFSGVGCGIMINGEIYQGSSGCAGELSVHNPNHAKDCGCQFGNSCLLERWEADIGILDEARKRISTQNNSKILEFCKGSIEDMNLRHIIEAVNSSDPLALEIVESAAHKLGVKIAFLVNLLNPQLVVIGGGLEAFGLPLINKVKHTVSEWAFEEASSAVKIIPSKLEENAVALGAANLIVRDVFTTIKD